MIALDESIERRLQELVYDKLYGAHLVDYALDWEDDRELSFVVLSRRASYPFLGRPFATHRANLWRDLADSTVSATASLTSGTYDLDFDDAVKDYRDRTGKR